METDQFFVSVIIPVYNGEAYLTEAVASIQRQNYEPLEIIIVDDGSTDNTAGVVTDLQADNIQYVHQSNSGAAVARNKGLKMAKGNIIGFLDADDLWSGDKLAVQLTCLAARPNIEVVMGNVQWMHIVAEEGDKPRFEEFEEPFACFSLTSALFRRSVFEKVGLCDPALRYSEDVDWFMRAREQGVSIAKLEAVTLFYRLHELSTTHGKSPQALNVLKVLKMSLDRRRKGGNSARELMQIRSISCSEL